jgi:DNA-binding transcriptional MerR regulator
MSKELLQPSEAGRRLGITGMRVKQLADEGVLPIAAKTSTGMRLFKAGDVEALRLQREKNPPARRRKAKAA